MFNSILVKVKYLYAHCTGFEPEYSTDLSAGMDLKACLESPRMCIEPGSRLAVGTGLAMEIITPGIAGFIFSRSGLGTKEGLVVSQGVGVIDPDYRGEVIVSLLNNSKQSKTIVQGQRIAQMLFMPVYQARLMPVSELGSTPRGEGGFGHTGKC